MLTHLLPSFLVLWLLPCALQDYRQRRVANALTIPAFFAAWPLALWLGGTERVMFTLAVFAGCWLAWGMGSMGAADGKIATMLAAASPAALGLSVLFLVVGFVAMRLRRGESVSLPAAVAFYGGSVGVAVVQQLAIGS
jgi:Flp pilus assembly protein protease CpaA